MFETQNKEHYNLFYIFAEDKKKSLISPEKAIIIMENAYHNAKSTYSYYAKTENPNNNSDKSDTES